MLIELAIGLVILALIAIAAVILVQAREGADFEVSMRQFAGSAPDATSTDAYESTRRVAA